MGQFTRISRAERFVEEFGEDLVDGISKDMGIAEGDKWELTKIFIATQPGCEDVVAFAVLKAADGKDIEVQLPAGCLFDPEYSEMEDQADTLEPLLNIPSATIMQRFEKAELL